MLFIVLLAVLAVLIYLYGIKPYSYWKKKNVKHLATIPLFGNMFDNISQKENFTEMLQKVYKLAPNDRYVGFYLFTTPVLIIRDPELLKQITVKDFDSFPEHQQTAADDIDPLWTNNLFALRAHKWRTMRPTLSPSFTSSKMRVLFSLMADCAERFVEYFQNQPGSVHVVELKEVFTRFTTDVIGTCAFGVECDSLTNKTNDFYMKGKGIADFSGLKVLRFFVHNLFPTLMRILGVKILDQAASKFFKGVILDTIKLREEKGIIRPDMIHLLMEARRGKKTEETNVDTGFATVKESASAKTGNSILTDDEIVAQAVVFFLAGFETVATVMCFLSYELAVNKDIQEKLVNEIEETLQKCKGKVSYEDLLGMKYLDMAITETLRMWPPTPVTDRICAKTYTISPEQPGENPLEIPPGSTLFVPIQAIHRDPKYYQDPDKFDPERFSEENKHNINPLTYLPFGAGPRNCIGSRFALMETKIMIFNLLQHFEIVTVEKTHIPMVLSNKHISATAKDGMWLGFKPKKVKSL